MRPNLISNLIDRRFYFLMSLLTAAIFARGFGPAVPGRLIHPPYAMPTILYVHVAIATAWMALLLVQSGLVQVRRVSVHRTLGLWGLLLGAALPVAGVWVTIAIAQVQAAHGDAGAASALPIPLSEMLTFAVLFALAALWRKQSEAHRRLILLAAITMTAASFVRFPRWLVPQGWFDAPVDLLIGACVLRDLIVIRRVHPVYLIGLPLLIASQVLVLWVCHAAWWQPIGQALVK
jgi:hypothetical protein